jgi:hypothetical protein
MDDLLKKMDELRMEYRFLPEHMWRGYARWILYAIQPGSFLTAVLENKLMESVSRADSINLAALPIIVVGIDEYTPMDAKNEGVKTWKGLLND